MSAGVNIFTLMAIPLFILAGELMTQAGLREGWWTCRNPPWFLRPPVWGR